MHPVEVGRWSEVVVAADRYPSIYVWAGYVACKAALAVTKKGKESLTLTVVTRVLGCGKPEMHPGGVREFDDYLECKNPKELTAWCGRKKKEQMDRFMDRVKEEMLNRRSR